MKNLARSVASFTLYLMLASTLYGWTHPFVHRLAMNQFLGARHWPVMLALAILLVAPLWILCRRYHFVRRVAVFMLGVAVLHSLMNMDRPWLGILAGCLLFVMIARAWYRHRNSFTPSSLRGKPFEAGRAKYVQAAFSDSISRGRESQPVVQDAAPAPARNPEPAYRFDELVSQSRFDYSAIVGMASTKARLLAAGREILENPKAARNGILLSGEPGNGKTMFAEALAGELGVPIFCLDYGAIASKWVNETPAKVKAAFAQARELGRGVFFIDEVDSLVKPRGDGTHHMDRDLTNVILTEVVRLRGTQIVLVAATNSIGSLDSASIREGRFDFKIEVPPPDLDARTAILRRSIGEAMGFHALAAPVLANLAARWEGFSAARLTSLGQELADMRREGAISEGKLTFDIVMRAMRRLQGSKGKLPEKVKSIDEIIMPELSRNDLHDLAFRLRYVYRLEQLGGRLPRGVLFFGPPGTGKTQAALALAAASGYAFLKTTGADLLRDPAAWDRLVKDANNLRPVIVFIDEAEDVLSNRRMSGVAPVTNRILTTLDGADGRVPDVLYICATNHPDGLDEAVLRGGRLELAIQFAVPTHESLTSYVRVRLKAMAGDVFAVSRHTMDCAASGLRGCSIADADAVLQRVIDAAAMRHMREGTSVITAEDVRDALRKTYMAY